MVPGEEEEKMMGETTHGSVTVRVTALLVAKGHKVDCSSTYYQKDPHGGPALLRKLRG